MKVPKLALSSAVSRVEREARLARIEHEIQARSLKDTRTLGYDAIGIAREKTGILLNGYRREDIEAISRRIPYEITPRDTRSQADIDRDLDLTKIAVAHTRRHQKPRHISVSAKEYDKMAYTRVGDGRDHSTWSSGKDELTKHYLRVAHARDLRDLAIHPGDGPLVVRAQANEKVGEIWRRHCNRKVMRIATRAFVTIYRPDRRVTSYPAPELPVPFSSHNGTGAFG